MNLLDILSPSALEARIERGRRLLHAGAKHLREAPPGDAAADKAACEIALLYWAWHRGSGGRRREEAADRELLDSVEARLRSEAVLQGLLWRPARVPMLTMGTALLEGLGRPDTRFQALARRAWRCGAVEAAERSPYQALEMEWSAGVLGVDCARLNPASSLLAKKLCPYLTSVSDGYAFTHSVFYATDFGARAMPATIATNQLWENIECGLLWSLVRFDFDLLGEFLLCAQYSRLPRTGAYYLSVAALLLTWDENGFVPDRSLSGAAATSKAIFFAIYHANIVAMLLAAELGSEDVEQRFEPPRHLACAVPDWQALTRCLGSARGTGIMAPALDRQPAASGAELLDRVLGRQVAARLVSVLGAELLAGLEPDLLVAWGLTQQQPEVLFAGLQAALAQRHSSASIATACEWLGHASALGQM
jgi:hypothetical protein